MSCDPMTIAHLQIGKLNCSRAAATARVRHKTTFKLFGSAVPLPLPLTAPSLMSDVPTAAHNWIAIPFHTLKAFI